MGIRYGPDDVGRECDVHLRLNVAMHIFMFVHDKQRLKKLFRDPPCHTLHQSTNVSNICHQIAPRYVLHHNEGKIKLILGINVNKQPPVLHSLVTSGIYILDGCLVEPTFFKNIIIRISRRIFDWVPSLSIFTARDVPVTAWRWRDTAPNFPSPSSPSHRQIPSWLVAAVPLVAWVVIPLPSMVPSML